jgi:hypothetical protein
MLRSSANVREAQEAVFAESLAPPELKVVTGPLRSFRHGSAKVGFWGAVSGTPNKKAASSTRAVAVETALRILTSQSPHPVSVSAIVDGVPVNLFAGIQPDSIKRAVTRHLEELRDRKTPVAAQDDGGWRYVSPEPSNARPKAA